MTMFPDISFLDIAAEVQKCPELCRDHKSGLNIDYRTRESILEKSGALEGAFVLFNKSTSSLPVLQIPIWHYEINYE